MLGNFSVFYYQGWVKNGKVKGMAGSDKDKMSVVVIDFTRIPHELPTLYDQSGLAGE